MSENNENNGTNSPSSPAKNPLPSLVPISKYYYIFIFLFFRYKLVFLGESGVGKTSIIANFMYDTFDTKYKVFFNNK